ncbi:MAG: hypothetical protein ACRBBR_14750 [Cellvibrionaceae bacterium]
MNNLKRIEDITIDDLMLHRWCYYQNDEEGYDAFEYVISDSHPHFSNDIIELEFAEFEFSNGKTYHGLYDGSESFNIVTSSQWYSLWYGPIKPEKSDIDRLAKFLAERDLEFPVIARSKWSGVEKIYNGIQYISEEGDIREVVL